MSLKQVLCLIAFTSFQKSTTSEVVATTTSPQPVNDYQEKFLTVLTEISHQLSKLTLEISKKCQENHHQDLDQVTQKLEMYDKYFNSTKLQLEKIATDVEKMKETPKALPKNCHEILKRGTSTGGVYVIRPNPTESFTVRCNMEVLGGGWTFVLNRFDGSQDFYLNWDDYKKGFGNLDGEFWLGLHHLHELAGEEDNELLVELVGWDGKKARALYSNFRIGGEEEGFALKVLEGYSGDAGDSLKHHFKSKFSTFDRDQDSSGGMNCAHDFHGAWWYYNCYSSQLTGSYVKGTSTTTTDLKGMTWTSFQGYRSLKEARMLIRPQVK